MNINLETKLQKVKDEYSLLGEDPEKYISQVIENRIKAKENNGNER